ncbi:687_t:CDS:2 [Gigaspora rosea]|nr:687_t:CDS:2 [Gigaspora rosea]
MAQEQRIYRELITEPIKFTPEYNRVIGNTELPVVKNELSISLKLYLESHGSEWHTIFYKGRPETINIGLYMDGYGLLLNQWYHVAYTLSNLDKRMNFYIDGEWVGSLSITYIQSYSMMGEDPTKHNDNDDNDECLNKSFVYLTIAFFLGIMVMILVGILFIPSIIIRRSYQAIPNPM